MSSHVVIIIGERLSTLLWCPIDALCAERHASPQCCAATRAAAGGMLEACMLQCQAVPGGHMRYKTVLGLPAGGTMQD
jgi:hypothetical protein